MGARGPKPGSPKNILAEGTRFGRLIVTGPPVLKKRTDGRNRAWYPVRCDCGDAREVVAANLRSGNTTSCGCWHRERASASNFKHGASVSASLEGRLYRIWKAMNHRCNNPGASNYKWYGGKGIRVCRRWHAFPPFRDWALSNGYEPGLTIDRRDSRKGYSPANCEWVTRAENARRARVSPRRSPG